MPLIIRTRIVATFLVASLVVLSSGCGDTHDKVVRESIDTMEELAGILESIETTDDAIKAQGKLERVAGRMKENQERMAALGTRSKDLEAALKDRYEDQLAAVLGRILSAKFKLAFKPEVAQLIESSMSDAKKLPLKPIAFQSGR